MPKPTLRSVASKPAPQPIAVAIANLESCNAFAIIVAAVLTEVAERGNVAIADREEALRVARAIASGRTQWVVDEAIARAFENVRLIQERDATIAAYQLGAEVHDVLVKAEVPATICSAVLDFLAQPVAS